MSPKHLATYQDIAAEIELLKAQQTATTSNVNNSLISPESEPITSIPKITLASPSKVKSAVKGHDTSRPTHNAADGPSTAVPLVQDPPLKNAPPPPPPVSHPQPDHPRIVANETFGDHSVRLTFHGSKDYKSPWERQRKGKEQKEDVKMAEGSEDKRTFLLSILSNIRELMELDDMMSVIDMPRERVFSIRRNVCIFVERLRRLAFQREDNGGYWDATGGPWETSRWQWDETMTVKQLRRSHSPDERRFHRAAKDMVDILDRTGGEVTVEIIREHAAAIGHLMAKVMAHVDQQGLSIEYDSDWVHRGEDSIDWEEWERDVMEK